MAYKILLDKNNAPLNRLLLARIQLDASCPSVSFDTHGETLLYNLVGTAHVYDNDRYIGAIGGRRVVTEPSTDIVRFPCLPSGMTFHVTLTLQGYAADFLVASCLPGPMSPTLLPSSSSYQSVLTSVSITPYVHKNDCHYHDVGYGAYRRTVCEVPTPHGSELHCGQTISDGKNGTWSSWPSHAAPEELERYAEHEEAFFCLTSGYFIMRMEGKYCTGKEAKELREIRNGEALATPLGNHEICVSPGDVGVYIWIYLSFLKKKYNAFANESISKVYIK